jgi:hypothetical protein
MVSHTKGPNSKSNFLKNTDSVLSQSLEYPKYRDAVIIVCVVCILISLVGGVYLLIRNTELPLEKVKNFIDTEKARFKKTKPTRASVERKDTKELKTPFYVFIQQTDKVYEYGKLKYTVQKGDILEILIRKKCRSGSGECWKVKNVKTGMTGYVKADSMKELHSIGKKSKTE